jgi:phosphonate transport system substrate-binding protein
MLRSIFVIVLMQLSLPLQATPENPAPDSYRLGIFPYMAPRKIVELFGPISTNMESTLKHPVKLESTTSFQDYRHLLEEQKLDIAMIQPFDYPKVVDEYGYLPLARQDEPLITRFMVREDSKYHSLKDLQGTTIALPPEPSANARMSIRALYDNKLIPGRDITVTNFKSHDDCLQQVWIGEASACGTSSSPLLVFEKRMQAKLRSIYDTPLIPHVLFVIHPRVPAESRAKLLQLITGWNKTDDGQAMMKALGFPGFVPAKPADYAVMHNYDTVVATATKVESPPAEDLVLGVFPYITPRKLTESFAPALPALSNAAGKNVILRTAASYDAFSDATRSAKYDIVLVQPFDYAKAVAHGYLPLAGMKDHLQGNFFVLKESPYKQVSDFKGKLIALPPIDAAHSRLARQALVQAGLVPDKDVTMKYRKNHEACIQLLKSGEAVACATSTRAIGMLSSELTQGLRSVGMTEKIPGVIFMVHKRVPEKEREKFHNEILSWRDSTNGRNILNSIQFGDFISVNIDDYLQMPKFD